MALESMGRQIRSQGTCQRECQEGGLGQCSRTAAQDRVCGDRLHGLDLFSSFLSQALPSQLLPPSLQSVLKEASAVSCCVCQPLGIPEHNLLGSGQTGMTLHLLLSIHLPSPACPLRPPSHPLSSEDTSQLLAGLT